jgi:hypothetical protein
VKKNLVDFLPISFVCLCFIAMGYAQWPGLHWDAACFTPPVFSTARGDGFAKPAYPVYNVRVPGEYFNFHGMLSVILFGKFLIAEDGVIFLRVLGFANAVTALMWWGAFRRTFTSQGDVLPRWMPLLAAVAAGSIAVGLQGRPEHPAVAVAALPFLFPRLNLFQRSFSLAVTAGLLFCCSPSSGVLAGTGVAVYLGLRPEYNPTWFLKWFCSTGVLAVLFFCCSFAFTPFGPLEWVSALREAASYALDFSSHLYRFRNGGLWGASLLLPFWNVVILFLWSLIFFLLLRRRRLLPLCVFSAVSLKHYSVFTDYGYACVYLPLLVVLLTWAQRTSLRTANTEVWKWTSRLCGLWLLCFVGVFLQYLTECLAFTQLPKPDESLAELRQICSEGQGVGIDNTMAAFVTDAPQSYVIMNSYLRACSPFAAVNPDFQAQAWKEDERKYFQQQGAFPRLLIVPSTRTDPPPELILDGASYRLQSQSLSYGQGVSMYRGRVVGYPFAAYVRQ